jgi:hypothetical protein
MAVLTGPLASTTLLLCVVLVLTLVAAPAHAWMNETRTIRRCKVAVRVDYEVDQKDEAKGVSMIGRQVTSTLETTAVEVAPSSLYEVAYTITPCHTPSAFSS